MKLSRHEIAALIVAAMAFERQRSDEVSPQTRQILTNLQTALHTLTNELLESDSNHRPEDN